MWAKDFWKEEDHAALREHLLALKDETYQQFHRKLVPNVAEDTIIGVRLPLLRRIAKEIVKGNGRSFLVAPFHGYYEENMLHGLVVSYLKGDVKEVQYYISGFLPYVDNWAVCDSFVSGLKIINKNRASFYSFICEYLHKEQTYALRFAVTALMDYYTDSEYIEAILVLYDGISHTDYYVKMAVAWAISVAYVKEKEQTAAFLRYNHLDDFTYNKALQKIVESNRVSQEEKEQIRKMKRK